MSAGSFYALAPPHIAFLIEYAPICEYDKCVDIGMYFTLLGFTLGSKIMAEQKTPMQLAEEAVKTKEIPSIRAAAKAYGVPRSTLGDRLSGRVRVLSDGSTRPGPNTVLTKEEEDRFVKYCLGMSKMGFGLTRGRLVCLVQRFLQYDGRENPFTEDRPGKSWWKGFLNRHPELGMRTPEPLSLARAIACSESKMDEWFNAFEDCLKENGLLDRAERIWNCDESGFQFCHKSARVLDLVGRKDCFRITSESKTTITNLACICANGQSIPPMTIFPGVRFSAETLEGCSPDTYVAMSPSGWMDTELFFSWFTEHFLLKIPPARPVVLLLDGHDSHVNFALSEVAHNNGVILYLFPPHCTHVLQPCDVSLFKSMKSHWNRVVDEFAVDHPGEVVTKRNFNPLFAQAWIKAVKPETIVNGFATAGICPLDRRVIVEDKVAPSTLFHRPSESTSGDDVSDESRSQAADVVDSCGCGDTCSCACGGGMCLSVHVMLVHGSFHVIVAMSVPVLVGGMHLSVCV